MTQHKLVYYDSAFRILRFPDTCHCGDTLCAIHGTHMHKPPCPPEPDFDPITQHPPQGCTPVLPGSPRGGKGGPLGDLR